MSWIAGGNVIEARRAHFGFGTSTATIITAGYTTGFVQTTEKYNGTSWSTGNNCGSGAVFYGAGIGTSSAGIKAGGNADGTANGTQNCETYDGTNWTASANLNVPRVVNRGFGTQSACLTTAGLNSVTLQTTSKWNGTSWSSAGNMYFTSGAGCGGTSTAGMTVSGTSNGTDGGQITTMSLYNGTTWSAGTNCNVATRLTAAGGTTNASVLKCGGGATASPVGTTELWNGTTWSIDTSLSAARNYHTFSGTTDSGIAVSGYNGSANLSSTEIWSNLQSLTYSMSGGGIAGGSGPTLKYTGWHGIGGAIVGGNTVIQQALLFISGSGGGIAGGASTVLWNGGGQFSYDMTGGAVVGGAADIFLKKLILASGGAIGGGTAGYSYTIVPFIVPFFWGIFNSANVPVIGGAAQTTIKILRTSDNFIYDWADTTYKSSAWTNITTTLTEIDAVNFQGYYKKDVDISLWNDGWYWVSVDFTGSPRQNSEVEILVMDGKIFDYRVSTNADAKISTRLPTTSYTAPDNVGIANIKAKTDLIVWTDIERLLGLALDNHVEDDFVYDSTGNLISSTLYCYSSAASAASHAPSGGPGVLYKVQVSGTYSVTGKLTKVTSLRVL